MTSGSVERVGDRDPGRPDRRERPPARRSVPPPPAPTGGPGSRADDGTAAPADPAGPRVDVIA